MKKYLLFISAFVYILNVSAQELIYKNYYQADSLLKIIEENYSGNNKLVYSGVSFSVGHYDSPEKQQSYPISYRLSSLNKEFILDKELMYNGNPFNSTMIFSGDSCSYNDYGKKDIQIVPLKGKEFFYFYLPKNIVITIIENKPTLHLINTTSKNYILGFNNSFGNKFYISVNKTTNLINKLVMLEYDDLYGDSYKEIIYSDYKNNIPYSIIVNDNQIINTELHLDSVVVEKELFEINPISDYISIETLSDGLYIVKLLNHNNKILVTEHANFLAVYEAPINVVVGNEIISFLKKQFNNKPIEYCFLSHHHPDHAGAISAFANTNAKIVTTKGNIEYFNKLSKSIHTLEGKNFYPSKNNNEYIIIDSLSKETFFKTSSTPNIVYESGATTDHTNEFLYFYFPKQKILFVGDLVIFPKEKIIDQKKRALSVYNFIKSKKLKVEKIYTGWPLKDQKEFGTTNDLKNSLLKSYPDLK
jgi:glyoxylase-like metal-dependent hydrolase (beta-lactamase superfamily II)